MSLKINFADLKIKTKLLVGFGSLIGFLIVFGLIMSFGLQDIKNNQLPAHNNITNLNVLFLSMRVDEKDFLSHDAIDPNNKTFFDTGKSPALDRFESDYKKFNQNLDQIVAYQRQKHLARALTVSDTLQTNVKSYHATMRAVADKYKTRGFKDFGLEGQLREAIHEVEAKVSTDPPTQVDMLLSRRHEKDFFLRREQQYIDKFDNQADVLASHFTDQPELAALVVTYKTDFHNVAAIMKDIGLSDNEGLQGKMTANAKTVETVLAKASQSDILGEVNSKIGFINITLYGLTALLTLLGIAFTFILTRAISGPVIKVRDIANDIAAGNVNTPIPTLGKDEMGDMMRAIDKLRVTVKFLLADAKAMDEEATKKKQNV